MADEDNEMLAALNAHAELLNSIDRPKWFARPFYEYLSDGLVWNDETDVTFDAINVLRPLFNHRSALILGKDDDTWPNTGALRMNCFRNGSDSAHPVVNQRQNFVN